MGMGPADEQLYHLNQENNTVSAIPTLLVGAAQTACSLASEGLKCFLTRGMKRAFAGGPG